MKKTLAILLSLALIICMMPATAFATGETTPPTPTALTATINKTSDLYTGADITFPSVTVTGQPSGTTPYTAEWTNASGTEVTAATAAGTYTLKLTASEGYTITPATFTYTVEAVDFNKVAVSYSGSKEKPANFATAKEGDTVALGGTVTVTQNEKPVNSSLYTYTITKADAERVKITVTPKANDASVVGPEKFIYVTLTSTLVGAYKIWGTGKDGIIPDQTYNNGSPLTPQIYVIPASATSTGATGRLTQGIDYKVTYLNNTSGSQTATVLVEGMGKYSGTLDKPFTIVGKNISYASVTGDNTKRGAKPVLTIKDGNKELKEGVDYEVTSWDSNTVGSSAGKATIQGKVNYAGTKVVTYNVVSENNFLDSSNVTFTNTTKQYNGSTHTANVTVKVTDPNGTTKTLYAGTDYTVSYTYRDSKGNTVRTTAPKNAGTYFAYITGRGSYATTGEVPAGTLTIEPVPLDYAEIVLGSSTVLQSGVYVPKVSVKHIVGNFYFQESDYNVEYRYVNSASAYLRPIAIVTPTANGNLTTSGSTKKQLEKEFSLASRSLSNCLVNFTDYRSSKAYDGVSNFQPSLTVKDTSLNRTLVKGADYNVTYKNSRGEAVYYLKDAGTYDVIVTGAGAYSGTRTLTYTITGTDISGYTVTLRESSVQADGYGRVPVIASVKSGYYSSLSANDYTVSYEGPDGKKVTSMVTPGTYKVIVTGKNGYMGSTYANFRIIGIPQTLTIEKTAYKVYEDSESFKITARATGDGTGFSYTSNDPSVATVSSTGVVTMHKVGRAVITVTTVGNKKSEPASDEVYVKVHPDKGYITRKPWNSGKKAQMKVRWQYQKGVTKYQIKYSTSKSFKNYDVKTVKAHGKDYTTQSTTVKNLKSGKQYYFKVRAVYETYNEKGTKITYFGKWSNWRSAKVK